MRSVFLGGTKHIPVVYDTDTLAYLREAAGLCDTIFSKKDMLNFSISCTYFDRYIIAQRIVMWEKKGEI